MNVQMGKDEPIKVLVVTSNHMMRAGLRMILGAHPGMSRISELSGNDNTGHAINRENPHVILIDMDVADANILDLIREIKKSAQDCRILLLGGFSDQELMHEALCSGAHGVVLKVQPPAVLFAAIESLCDRSRIVVHHSLQSSSSMPTDKNETLESIRTHQQTNDFVDSLTSREREIIELVSKGLANKNVADRLCISETTVRHHLTSIFGKLQVSNRQQLLIFAHQQGLIELSVRP